MPVYEYLCNDCGPFTDMRPMAECDAIVAQVHAVAGCGVMIPMAPSSAWRPVAYLARGIPCVKPMECQGRHEALGKGM